MSVKIKPNGRRYVFGADCGLLSCRAALPLLRATCFLVSTKPAMKYSVCYRRVFFPLSQFLSIILLIVKVWGRSATSVPVQPFLPVGKGQSVVAF
jgi:hypothetical protein